MGNTAQQCRLGLFQDSDLAGDLEDSKSTSGKFCAYLEVICLFPQVGCVRNRLQFHTILSTEAEIISLDTVLR